MVAAKQPVDGLTTRHVLYLIIMHTIGAMILDGGINFGLATAMYKSTKFPVSLWPLPNTLAGDSAVTIILQQTLTWILDRLAVVGDLKKGMVAPLRMPSNASGLVRWFVGIEYSKVHPQTLGERLSYVFHFHVKRIVVIIVATFIVYWSLAIAVLSILKANAVGADHSGLGGDFNPWPMPEIYKGIYGALLGLTTPFMTYIALIWNGEQQCGYVQPNEIPSEDDSASYKLDERSP
ncbi:hypothetical protein DFQ27_004093 [Actinomortierella ambigua]|uniref:Uncharacterized protein n=1 Tax=Actinomortierella ambigua TaxID=1343610 RepID=A0A9P6U4K7_9FUNG|nr:hypothetical protein DFQ27_004093 [Actinomortierella ambigua]